MATKKSRAIGAYNIRSFRHEISILKKKGLIRKSIDARSVKPSKHFLAKVKEYRPVIEGRMASVKVPAKSAASYIEHVNKSARFVKGPQGPRLLVPKAPDEKVTATRSGLVRISHPAGMERVQIPVAYHNLEQWLRAAKRKKGAINGMKKRGERFAFNFMGNHSISFFDDIGALLDTLQHYNSVEASIEGDDSEYQESIYQNLEIIKFKKGAWYEPARNKRPYNSDYNSNAYYRRKAKLDRNPHAQKVHDSKHAQQMREYRARMKENNPNQYEAYKQAALERANDSKSQKNIKAAKKSKKRGKK